MTTTTAVPGARHAALPSATGRAGLAGTVRSEWTKIRSVRSTYWTLGALIVVGIGLGAAICAATASDFSHGGHFLFDATARSQTAFVELGQLVLMVLGALVITAEYSTGMIRTSLTSQPRRGTVYLGKGVVFTAIAVLVSLVTSFLAFFLGQALLHSTGRAATLSDPNVMRAIVGSALYVAVIGLMAFAIGAIIRHTAGTIATMVGILFILPLIVDVLPASWSNDINKWLPSSAGEALLSTVSRQGSNLYSAWPQFAITVAYTAVLLIAGAVLFRKRDA